MPASYRLHHAVELFEDDIPVRLRLQERTDVSPAPFYMLSWRTNYAGGTSNRRFYWAGGEFWRLRAQTAKDLLVLAESKGMLAPKHDDSYRRFGGGLPTFEDSRALGNERRRKLWSEITDEARESGWGPSPEFVVAAEPGGLWRKVLIVDSDRRFATFRSCTKDADYGMRIEPSGSSTWFIDNAMQDAGSAIARRFLEFLRETIAR